LREHHGTFRSKAYRMQIGKSKQVKSRLTNSSCAIAANAPELQTQLAKG